jgi:hypothetical protein
MDMEQSLIQKLNDKSHAWSKDTWLQNKTQLNGCINVQGAILKHDDSSLIYFAPEPTHFSVVYEIRVEDIVECLPAGITSEKLGASYDLVRIYVRPESILLRMETRTAQGLLEDCHELRNAINDGGYDEMIRPLAGPNSRPAPSPSPRPEPRPHQPGGGVASGVRG